jgi:hypothetical protein
VVRDGAVHGEATVRANREEGMGASQGGVLYEGMENRLKECVRRVSVQVVTPVVNSGRHELQPHAAGC